MGTVVMKREEREVDRFAVKADDGERFILVEYQATTRTLKLDGSTPIAQGKSPTLLRLSDGREVNFIDSETFQIVDTNQIIRKVG